MVIRQGEVWWADLPEPVGSEPGFRRPVVVVQGDRFNRSSIATALCVPLTSNVRLADSPGNLLLPSRSTGLPRDSVANVSLVLAVNKRQLVECVGQVSQRELDLIFGGIDVVLERT
ncbi:MAG TPA: type II toxin-antitoxin system PemK/MazF family toxin [Thermoanaerobaculia bacterium]|nr:type II toxin-antitoxin system PemK/MazF family toxin [Thermoanaerobaculia bacterium]